MAIVHTCGTMAYRLSYQKRKIDEDKPTYFKTNRYYCQPCDIIIKITEDGE